MTAEQADTPSRLEFILTNGQRFEVDVSDWTIRKREGTLSKLEWTTPEGKRDRLVHIRVDEIVAIIEHSPLGGTKETGEEAA